MSAEHPSQWACLAEDFERYLDPSGARSNASWRRRVRVALGEEAFWVIFWYRFGRWARIECRIPVVAPLARVLASLVSRILRMQFGISISAACEAGPGLYFGHYGGVWINPNVRLGRQVSILNGVTIGEGGQGATAGVPTIGDFVYIGPHATIVSKVRIGNGCVIASNSLVVADVPDGATAIGVPARVLVRGGNPVAARAAEAARAASSSAEERRGGRPG